MDTDLRTGKVTLSFQPEVLPKVQSVSFAGNEAVANTELNSALNPIMANADYTDRRFATAVELNLRPVYEQHGYYRVKLTPGSPVWTDAGVSVGVTITEGAPYQLGKVDLIGDDLPTDAMLAAAKFPAGKLANWEQIQNGIWELEKVVKRTGFFQAAASSERYYDDTAHVLDLRVRLNKGPLYRFGEIRFTGLSPDLEAQARRLWKPKTGDPYDYAYQTEFFQAFSRMVDFHGFRKHDVKVQKGAGDYVMDINLIFEMR
jgi:outer membrane protein assembly factor BamA